MVDRDHGLGAAILTCRIGRICLRICFTSVVGAKRRLRRRRPSRSARSSLIRRRTNRQTVPLSAAAGMGYRQHSGTTPTRASLSRSRPLER